MSGLSTREIRFDAGDMFRVHHVQAPCRRVMSWVFAGSLTLRHGVIIRSGSGSPSPKRWCRSRTAITVAPCTTRYSTCGPLGPRGKRPILSCFACTISTHTLLATSRWGPPPPSPGETSDRTSRSKTAGACTTARSSPFSAAPASRLRDCDHRAARYHRPLRFARRRGALRRRRCAMAHRGAGDRARRMFPLLEREKPNTVELFQIWLNLPGEDKLTSPHFSMLWSRDVRAAYSSTPGTQDRRDHRGRPARRTTRTVAAAAILGIAPGHRRRHLVHPHGPARNLDVAARAQRGRGTAGLFLPRSVASH